MIIARGPIPATDVFTVFKWSLNVIKTKEGDLDDAREITAV